MTFALLLLLDVNRAATQTGAVLLQLQLFAAGFAADGVIVVSRLFADEKHGFDFFLTFCHENLRFGRQRKLLGDFVRPIVSHSPISS